MLYLLAFLLCCLGQHKASEYDMIASLNGVQWLSLCLCCKYGIGVNVIRLHCCRLVLKREAGILPSYSCTNLPNMTKDVFQKKIMSYKGSQ